MDSTEFPDIPDIPTNRPMRARRNTIVTYQEEGDVPVSELKHKDFVMLFHGGFDNLCLRLKAVDAPLLAHKLFERLVWNLSRLRGRGNIVPCDVKAIAHEFDMSSSMVYYARKKLIDADAIRKFRGTCDSDDPEWMVEYRTKLVEVNPYLAFSGSRLRWVAALHAWVGEKEQLAEEE